VGKAHVHVGYVITKIVGSVGLDTGRVSMEQIHHRLN